MDEELVKRIPPHSIEAEQSVIGSLLYSPEAIATAAEIVRSEDFYQRQYGIIYETIMELYQDGKPTDIVTLQDTLKTKDVPPEVYSLDFLKDLLNSVFTAANIRSYATIVAEKAQIRRTIRTLENLTDSCYLGKENADALMEKTEHDVFELMEKREHGDIAPIDEIMINVLGNIETAAKSEGVVTGLGTGFTDLDIKTAGLHNTDLVILAARPAMGKTAFALNLADFIAVRRGHATAVFSMEMSKEQIATRVLALESRVDSQKLRTGQLTDMEWDDIVEAGGIIAGAKLYIDDTPGLTPTELRSRCRKLKLEKKIELIIIDYLQLMIGDRNSASRQQEVADISRSLKGIAKELDVPILALSQLSRAPEQRDDHRPRMADLRESGGIEQDADMVMFLYRDEVYDKESPKKGIAEIIIGKQRNGETGTIELSWIPSLTRFGNLEKNGGNSAQ